MVKESFGPITMIDDIIIYFLSFNSFKPFVNNIYLNLYLLKISLFLKIKDLKPYEFFSYMYKGVSTDTTNENTYIASQKMKFSRNLFTEIFFFEKTSLADITNKTLLDVDFFEAVAFPFSLMRLCLVERRLLCQRFWHF